jgi:squalene-hopene/tetraprenyl-beta-curcumene cyclase
MKLVTIVVAASAFFANADLRGQSGPTDPKETINGYVRAIRATQNPDGTYGPPSTQPQTTARFVLALGTCPEKYVATDGPFVRNAIAAILAHQADDGGFTAPGSPRRIATSAEAYLALFHTAKLGYDGPLSKARSFLEKVPAADVANESVGDLLRLALANKVDGTYFASQLEPKLVADAEATWVKGFLERQGPAITQDLSGLDVAAVPVAVGRLLAVLDATKAAEAAKKSESKPIPEISYRTEPKDAAEARARIEASYQWLVAQQKNGRYGMKGVEDPGITAIALSAVMRTAKQLGIERPAFVKPGLDWLVSLQQEDGAIFLMGLKNYVTSVAVEAFVAAGDPQYAAATKKAVDYLKSSQLDDDEGYSSEADPYYGGFGYGSSEKPDLSNTQIALQAMHDAGVPADDASFRKVIDFLQRCQNRPESGAPPLGQGDGSIVVPGDDGGAVYRPGDSKAGTDPAPDAKEGDRRVIARSYGSMTYALLKSYLFAGLDPADPRVKAAYDWLCRNYTVDVNPGFKTTGKKDVPYQGLFYYYLTMARALKAFGATTLTDGDGVARDWRKDLRGILFRTQSDNGSWQNVRSSRWMEEDPVLVTSYALLALAETH